MKNKSVILLVLLLLITFGFTVAIAQSMETVTTITMKTGALLAEYEDVSQVLDITALRIHSMPEGYGAFALSLNGKDALQSMFKLEKDGIYVQSAMLGQQPLYFSWDDIKAFVSKQMESAAQMQPMDMPFDMDMMQAMMDGSLTDEQVLDMMGIDEELLTLISDIQAGQVAETGSFFVEGSDEANLKTMTEISGEDMIRIVELPMFRDMIANQTMVSDYNVSPEDFDQLVDSQITSIKQMITQSDITVIAAAYTKDDEFVAFTMDMNAELVDYNGEAVPIGIHVTLTRTSIESAKFYQLKVMLNQADQQFLNQRGSLFVSDEFVTGEYVIYMEPEVPLLEVVLNCDRAPADHTTAELALTVRDGDPQTVFLMMDQHEVENVKDTAIDVYFGGTVDEIKNALAETNLFTLKLHTVTQPDSGYFAAMQNATPDTSVQLLAMDETELQTYMQGIQQSMMMTLLTVVENLPPDISNSLMENMGGF